MPLPQVNRRKLALCLVAPAVIGLAGSLCVLGLQAFIGWEVRATGENARHRFDGDRVEALVKLVSCEQCGLSERKRAVWALGQLEDRRALPVLQKFHTGKPCAHGATLCQYELGKAIKKIEGTWNLQASLTYSARY